MSKSNKDAPVILLVDDEDNVRYTLARILEHHDYVIKAVPSAAAAFPELAESDIDAVIADYSMPGMSGLELLRKMRSSGSRLPFILMTAFGSEEKAVEAMKSGANDYLRKPFPNDTLLQSLNDVLREGTSGECVAQKTPGLIIGNSSAMQELMAMIDKMKAVNMTVLILGESGTGKELVARALHYGGIRSEAPFVTVNCGAIPLDLIESELFGHREGSFTGAHRHRQGLFRLAEGGTIFLDEVGDLPLQSQVKLLRVLEEGTIRAVGSDTEQPVDVRVIAATNANLDAAVRMKTFREDLFFRLNALTIRTPSLKDRPTDIPILADYFFRLFNSRYFRNLAGIAPDVIDAMKSYGWPGNVRELEKSIERAVILAEGSQIRITDMPENIRACRERGYGADIVHVDEIDTSGTYKEVKKRVLESFERKYFSELLKKCEGNISMVAREAGMHRKNLYKKLNDLDISAHADESEGEQ